MGNYQVPQGSQITVPIKVKDFINIISVQGTVEFNPAVLSYSSVQDFGLPGMNFNNFGTVLSNSGKITFSWYETQLIGQNLPDSAVIFSLKFNVTGSHLSTSPLNFINTPTSLEIINANLLAQNVNVANGSVTVFNTTSQDEVTLFLDTVTTPVSSQVVVSARVRDFVNINAIQGTLEFNPSIASFSSFAGFGLPNLSAGNFGLSLINSGKLTFSWNDTGFAGLNLPDSAVLFTMVFNVMGTAGQQTTLAFVNSPTAIEIADSLNNVLDYNLINGFIKIEGPTLNYDITVKIDTAIGPQGSQVDLAVRCWHFTNIMSMQGTISFNTSVATFDTISQYGLTGMGYANFGLTQINSGKLMFSWSDQNMTGVTLADSSVLFKIRLNLVGTAGSYTMLDFVNSPTPLEFTDNTFSPVNTQYISGKATISGDASIVLNDPTQLTYCAGNNFTVNYIANGIFITGNQFILQLSDAVGSFSSPVNLDTVISVNSGTFNATIPLNAITGTAYRLRVISSNPVVISNETSNISIFEIPLTPIKPTGDTLLCLNPANSTFTTQSVIGATAYNWVITPSNAGVVTPSGTTATIDWNNTFSGTVYIKVQASNGTCTGAFSDSLKVRILLYPSVPDKPTGDTLLCANSPNSTYATNTVVNATSYVWVLNPSAAGTITPNGTTATIDWNDAFTGDAYIKVIASNSNCQGVFSDSLKVKILTYPAVPDKPTGNTLFCINPPNSSYATNVVSGATGYIWVITPANAGTLIPSGNTVSVDWSNVFFGQATIKVKALNQICESAFSDTISITVNNPFAAPVKPYGDTIFCKNPADASYHTHSIFGATTYQWSIYPSNAGIVTGTDTVLSIDWDDAFTGTVYLFVSASNGVCNGMNSDSLRIHIYPYPLAPTATNQEVCEGFSIPDLTVTGTGTINWYNNPTLTPPVIYTGSSYATGQTSVGVYNYYVVQVVNTCQSPSTLVSLTIDPSPLAPKKPVGDTLFCINPVNSTYTTMSVSGATSYIWVINPASAGVINAVDTTATIDWNNSFTGIVYIKVAASNGLCTGPFSDSLRVNILVYPSAPNKPLGDTLLCANPANSTYTTNTVSNATSYTWSIYPSTAGIITPNGITASVDWNNTYTGDVYIKVQASNGICQGVFSDSLKVTILTIPAVPDKPQGDTLLCINPPNSLYFTNVVSGATSYVWDLLPANAGVMTPSGNSVNINWNNTFYGNVTIKVKALNQICESAFSIVLNITVSSPFQAPTKPIGDSILCINPGNMTYHTHNVVGATTYTWGIFPSNAGVITVTDTTVTVDWNNTFLGTAALYVSASNGVCSSNNSDSLSVHIYSYPTAPVATNQEVCFGLPVPNLTVSGTGTINWYDNASLTPPTIHTGSPYVTGITSVGIYDYWVTQTINTCESPATHVTLTINATPAKPVKPTGDSLLCQNPSNSTYTTQTVNGATTYNWMISPSNAGVITPAGTTAVIDWNNTFTGNAHVVVSSSNGVCNSINSDTLDVNIFTNPTAPTANNVDVCSGMPVPNLTATGIGTINWYANCNPSQLVFSGNSFATGQTATGSYNYCVTQVVNGCESQTAAVTLTINDTPATPSKPNGDTSVCQSSSNIIYTTASVIGTTAYLWILNPSSSGNLNATDTVAEIDWNPTFTGNVYLSVYAVNGGCNSLISDSLLINIKPLPQKPLKPSGDTIICMGSSTSVYTSGGLNADSYNWAIIPSTAGMISGTGTTVDINWTMGFSGQVKLFLMGVNQCGNGPVSDTLYITIANPPAQPVISVNLLQLTSSYTTGNQWYYEGAPIQNANAQVYNATQNGYYYVVYTDANGCTSASDSVQVIAVGTAFNNSNEIFTLYPNPTEGLVTIDASGHEIERLSIYDMLGRIIYAGQQIKPNLVFDLSSEKPGIYYVQMIHDKIITIFKVIKL